MEEGEGKGKPGDRTARAEATCRTELWWFCGPKAVPPSSEVHVTPLRPSAPVTPIELGLLAAWCQVQSLSRVRLFVTPWPPAHQASRSLPKLMSIESVMPSNHLILCGPLLLLPSIFPGIRVFSKVSALCIRWPKYRSFSYNISPSSGHSGLISLGNEDPVKPKIN